MLGFTRVGRPGEVEGQWHGTYRTLIKFYSFFLEISALSTPMAVEDKAVANLRDDHNIHMSVGFWGQTEDRLDQ